MTEKYVAETTPATCRHARFGAPAPCLAQLRRAGLNRLSLTKRGRPLTTDDERHVAHTFALSCERLGPRNPPDALAQAPLARSACFAPGEPMCW